MTITWFPGCILVTQGHYERGPIEIYNKMLSLLQFNMNTLTSFCQKKY